MIQIDTYKKHNIMVVKIKGDIDFDDVSLIEDCFDDMINKGEFNILVNCVDISFISSSDISLFLRTYQRVKAERGELKLCNQNTFIQKVLRITSLEVIFPYYKSESDALKTFKNYRSVV